MDNPTYIPSVSRTAKLLGGIAFIALAAILHIGLGGISISEVKALSSFNTDAKDRATLRSSNYTQYPDSNMHWEMTTDADAGNVVSLAVYYHNSAGDVAENTKVSLSMPKGKSMETRPHGVLWADDFSASEGETLIRISTKQTATYIPGSAKWYPDQSLTAVPFPFGQNGDEVMTAEGVNIGSIESGWESQGSVVARFQISEDTTVVVPTGESIVDIKANGSDGPLSLTGESLTLAWVSGNVTNCNLLMDGASLSGVESNAAAGPLGTDHPFYPQTSAGRTFTVLCDGLNGKVSDSVVVTLASVVPEVPNAPTITAHTSNQCGGNVIVAWTPVSGADSYRVYRDGTKVAETIDASYEDRVTPESMHFYTVRAVTLSGTESADSNKVNVVASVDCPILKSFVDITANGSQGPVTVPASGSFTLEWVSGNATNCTVSLAGVFSSDVESNDSIGPIQAAHPYFPPEGGSHTFVINCNGVSGLVTDFVVVNQAVPQTPVPQAPTVSASTSTACGGMIAVSWNAVSGATSYELYRDGVLLSEQTATSYTDTVSPSSSHTYTVKALNATGSSVLSNAAQSAGSEACPVPQSSVDITANGSQGPVALSEGQSFTVEWVSGNVTDCSVSLAGIFNSDVPSNGSIDSIGPDHDFYPPEGGSHTFVIDCAGLSGTITDSVVVTRPIVSNPPSTPTITAETSTSCGGKVLISWSAVSGATSYKVFRGDAEVAVVSNALSFVDEGLTPGASYIYKVKAVNDSGESPFSNADVGVASDACLVPPSAPSIMAFTDTACGGNIVISWNTVNAASSYKVYRDDVKIAEVSGTSYTDTGLNPGESYTYTVRAENAVDHSAPSNSATATASDPCVAVPNAPEVFASTGTLCGGVIDLSWTSIENAVSYKIYRNGTLIAAEFDTSYTDTSLTPGTTYTYTVKAENSAGESPLSNAVSATASAACLTAPLPPTIHGSTATACGGAISLSWTASINATSYKLFRDGVQIATTSNTTHTDSGLATDTSYEYTVIASNSAGDSVVSNTTTVKSSKECPANNPNLSLTANPTTIFKGQNSVLSWTSSNTESCSAPWTLSTQIAGSETVSPEITTTYSMTCEKGAKSVTDTVTVTVVEAPQCLLPSIDSSLTASGKVGQSFSYTLTASSTGTSTLSYAISSNNLPDGLSVSGNTISGTPTTSGTFTVGVAASNECGTDTANLVITIAPKDNGGGSNNPTVNLTANPDTIFKGQNSTLSWTSNHTESCSATWTNATSTSGSQVVSPATTTAYSITCEKGNKSATDSVTITVLEAPQCTIPTITSSLTATGKVGSAFSYTFTANPAGTSTVFTIGTSTLPSGLTFSGDTISGTPTSSGTFSIPATVSNDCGFTTDYVLVITISPKDNGGNNDPTVGLVANPDSIKEGNESTLSWTSTNTDSCSATWTNATSTSGSQTVSPNETTSYSITCEKGNKTATDSVVVNVDEDNGGGGGGGGHHHSSRTRTPEVLGEELSCEYLKDYLRIDWINDPVEVIKLQIFLKELEDFDNLQVTRVFDQQTFDAVAIFQERYFDDILRPWGHDHYTGFVYILTKKKVNEIFCQKAFPLTDSQKDEIVEFRAFLESLKAQGIDIELPSGAGNEGSEGGIATTTDLIDSLDEFLENLGQSDSEDESGGLFGSMNLQGVAAAVFAGPTGWDESLKSLVIFFLILIASHAISKAVVAKKNEGIPATEEKMKIEKIFFFVLSLALATVLSFFFHYYDIILPLLILIIVLSVILLWLSLKKKEPRMLMTIPGKTEPIKEPKTEPIEEPKK